MSRLLKNCFSKKSYLNLPSNNLYSFLMQNSKNRILWIGMGNPFRNDDGVGVYISKRLKENQYFSVLTVELSLENHIGKINSIQADHVVLIDCISFGQNEGFHDILPIEKIRDYTVNTHHISLINLSELIKINISVLGIQPGNINFGQELSPEVNKSADQIIKLINGIITNNE